MHEAQVQALRLGLCCQYSSYIQSTPRMSRSSPSPICLIGKSFRYHQQYTVPVFTARTYLILQRRHRYVDGPLATVLEMRPLLCHAFGHAP